MSASKTELADQITALASPDEKRRRAAAAALFDRGAGSAWALTEGWMNDGALTGIFAVEAYGEPGGVHPETTVGIAVSPELFGQIKAANGNPPEAAAVPGQDAREFELRFSPKLRLDILTTSQADGNGAIARYLHRRGGGGIQQVEFRVYDVEGATALLRERYDLTPIYGQPQQGANGARVNFFLMAGPEGEKVLIELFQTP